MHNNSWLYFKYQQTKHGCYCIALRCVALLCVALRCVALRCVALRCVALRCVVLYCIALHRRVVLLTFGSRRSSIRYNIHSDVTAFWRTPHTCVDVLLPPEFATCHVMFTIFQVTDRLTHVEHVTVLAVRQPDLALGEIAQVAIIWKFPKYVCNI